jgi:hypothetical protein
MDATAAKPAREKMTTATAASTSRQVQLKVRTEGVLSEDIKPAGYGLPCAKCRAYYPADMNSCPICKSAQRVAPNAVVSVSNAKAPATATAPLGDDRERYLKELKSQAFASHTQINAAATFRCVLTHQHSGATEPAAVCHTCYSEARQQADRLEAALHMDPKDAAKIVYDAVWADTSDPNATYVNAANALLSELRKRAGVGLLLGSNQMLTH